MPTLRLPNPYPKKPHHAKFPCVGCRLPAHTRQLIEHNRRAALKIQHRHRHEQLTATRQSLPAISIHALPPSPPQTNKHLPTVVTPCISGHQDANFIQPTEVIVSKSLANSRHFVGPSQLIPDDRNWRWIGVNGKWVLKDPFTSIYDEPPFNGLSKEVVCHLLDLTTTQGNLFDKNTPSKFIPSFTYLNGKITYSQQKDKR